MNHKLYQGDCLDVMQDIPDGSVDLIVTDPPYYRVKNSESWDRQWDTPRNFLAWLDTVIEQCARVMKPNGSMYLFASPRMAARVEVLISERLNVLNRIRWIKEAGWHNRAEKEMLRSYLSPWEEIIFAEHYNADSMAKGEVCGDVKGDELRGFLFEPLRLYFDGERKRAGVGQAAMMNWFHANGYPKYVTARHTFSRSQWELPTLENYERLRRCLSELNGGGQYLDRPYEYLRREYEDLRREYEDLRRPFTVSADVPYTDVWTFKTVQPYKGKHPCEKPLAMMQHIVQASSKPDGVVLDPFMGSGSTGIAALSCGRRFIGIEKDAEYWESAQNRIVEHVEQEFSNG